MGSGDVIRTGVKKSLASMGKKVVLAAVLVLLTVIPRASWSQWIPIYTLAPNQFHSNGWNAITYSADTNLFYLLMSNGGGITPESNSFFSYAIQAGPVTTNPWIKVSSCGDGLTPAPTEVNRQGMHLAESITDTTGTCAGGCTSSDYVHLQLDGATNITFGSNPLYSGNIVNGAGVIWIADEAIRYGRCTATNSFTGPPCTSSSGKDMFLWGTTDGTAFGSQSPLLRGTRQTAGYSIPTAHNGGAFGTGENAGWDCYNPELGPNWRYKESPTDITGTDHDIGVNRAGSWSHPGERHAVQNETYDSKRGRMWVEFGFQESWQDQDTWSLPIFDKGALGGRDALSIAGATDVYTNTLTTPGWQRINWTSAFGLYSFRNPPNGNSGTSENASIYDPQNDVLVEMGGLAGGSARNEILIFCMSAASTGWGCNSGNIGTWIKLTAASGSACNTFGHYCGNTGKRDGGRLAFDSLNNRILLFGGVKSGYFWNSVAQFDAHTGDVCLSMVVMQLKAPPIAPMPWSGVPSLLSAERLLRWLRGQVQTAP